MNRIAIIRRRIRWAFYVGLIVGVAWFTWRFDVESIPADFEHLTPQKMPPGTTIILTDYDEDTVIGLESVIVYRAPGRDDSRCFGVIAGVPGETILLHREGDRVRMTVGDRKERMLLPVGHKIPAGEIPEGSYLLLHGDRHLVEGSAFPDSRMLGLIPTERFISKVVVPLNFF